MINLMIRRQGSSVVQREFIPRAPSASGTRYTFVVSAPGVDRTGSSINQSGWKLDAYRQNPVITWSHDATRLPVGRTTKIGVENGSDGKQRLIATMQFADTKTAQALQALTDSGFLSAASAGFVPLQQPKAQRDGTLKFEQVELLEWSLVCYGAHPDCQLISITGSDGKALTKPKAQRAAEIARIKSRWPESRAEAVARRRVEIAMLQA